MRHMTVLLIGLFLGVAFMLTLSRFQLDEPSLPSISQVEAASSQPQQVSLTADDLLEMARIYDQQADGLQAEAASLERKALGMTSKSHRDPKGFRRAGLMNIARLRWKAASEHRELAAMHRKEAERLKELAR